MELGTSETQTFVDGHIMAGSKEDADQDHHTGNCQYSAKEVPSEESHGSHYERSSFSQAQQLCLHSLRLPLHWDGRFL